jgi:hypothetical protein
VATLLRLPLLLSLLLLAAAATGVVRKAGRPSAAATTAGLQAGRGTARILESMAAVLLTGAAGEAVDMRSLLRFFLDLVARSPQMSS